MAEHAADHLSYWLQLKLEHKDLLGQIRHWDNLKVAMDETAIWVKDFTPAQLETNLLKSIPFARLFYSKDEFLYAKGSLLPSCRQPAFLWTPIARALPLSLPRLNHNFFEVGAKYPVHLVPAIGEQIPVALLIDIAAANPYIQTAAAARLQHLQWVLLNESQALIFGKPLLPLNGSTFWQQGNFLFPSGFELAFPMLQKQIAAQADPTGKHIIWWEGEDQYSLLPKDKLMPLSIASWRQTIDLKTSSL